MFRDADRWTGIVSDNNMIALNANFNSIISKSYIRAHGSGSLVGTDVLELYPLTDGTSTENTRFTISLSDETSSVSSVFANFYGGGGNNNEIGLNFFPFASRTGGAAGQIVFIDDNFSGDFVFRVAPGGNANNSKTERLRLTKAGRMGILTDNPSSLLHINDTDSRSTITLTNNASTLNGL